MRRALLLPLLSAALAIAPASAAGAAERGSVAIHPIAKSPEAVLEYWSQERMRSAEPISPPIAPEGSASDGEADAAALAPDQETNPALDTSYPQRIHGRLFVTFGGQAASCSATVVTARSQDLILTAGHCVVSPGELVGGSPQFATNVLFVPGYRNGTMPFGGFPARRLAAPAAWSQSGDLALDLGAANLAPGPAGEIQDALGARGVAFNRSARSYRNDSFEVYGYPASPPPDYDGQRPIVCFTQFQGFEDFTDSPVVAPCHQQQGSSGGGFVRAGRVESLISHGACKVITPACLLIAGTYFGETAFRLYERTSGGIPNGKRKRLKNCKRFSNRDKRLRCRGRVQRFSEDPR